MLFVNTMMLEYKPTWVKLPNDFKRDIVVKNHITGLLATKAENPAYDDYSFFYDVFFSLDRKYIWTVGPPLFSLEKKLFPIKISYKTKNLQYKYYNYKGKPFSCSAGFKILATNIKEKNPILTFSGDNWKIDIKIASFPSIDSDCKLVLATLQKNYSVSCIIEWILWHYRLHQVYRILFYDNGSDNANELKIALQKLDLPNLKIVFIHWDYYYGQFHPADFDDLFAQNTQLNHTLRLHSGQNYFIAGWDLDEYLVNDGTIALKQLVRKQFKSKPYLVFTNYPIVDVGKELANSIKDCTTRAKQPEPVGKYLYHSKRVKYLYSPHDIVGHQVSFRYYILSKFIYYFERKFLRRSVIIINQNFYLIHAHPIKVIWKIKANTKDRPFKKVFDPKIHIEDQNIQKSLQKAGLN